ncbi:MAG TPA: fibronectin type III domain-containing protein [Thermoanaerobaculia bacterium]|jgi:hypothetical protein|nr:fibronectin type III domain-containing protein [Thermoanaerobaculia bacterium]
MRSVICALLVILACDMAARRRAVRTLPAATWNAALTATATGHVTIAGKSIASSTRLHATWTAPGTIDHYVLIATETAGGPPLTFTASTSPFDLTNLESGTEYRISIRACLDAACVSSINSDASTVATTAEEYWQIRGSGSSFSTAERLVSDGNTKPFAIRWDNGTTQLYYDPNVAGEKGIKIATSSDPLTGFTPISGFGFRRGDAVGRMGIGPATFQVVPLTTRLGGQTRMFWEAAGTDQRARIYSRDSVDGWTGRDFHSGASTICLETDLAAGGACAAEMLIGTQGDAVNGNPKIQQARQFKLGLPLLDSSTWDETPGTFMIVTGHLSDPACSATFFNATYAVWNGTQWNVQYAPNGCPKLIAAVQAPMPVHVGGTRYKLYFNHNRESNGLGGHKPLKLLYADGAATGDALLVEFEDWETADRMRELRVLWPSGVELTDVEKSQFDDYQVWMPTRDPALQVMYSNMTCPNNACGAPFIGSALLVNP